VREAFQRVKVEFRIEAVGFMVVVIVNSLVGGVSFLTCFFMVKLWERWMD